MYPEQHPDDEPSQDAEHRIEAAMAGLDGIEDRPIGEHVAAFDAVHVALTDALSEIDKV